MRFLPGRLLVLAVLALLAVSRPALATITLVSDDRVVSSTLWVQGAPYLVVEDSPDSPFAAFTGSATSDPATPYVLSTLVSEVVTPTRMAATGTASGGDAYVVTPPPGSDEARGESTFSITFDVDSPTAFQFAGHFELWAATTSFEAVLLREGVPIFERVAPPWNLSELDPDGRWHFATSGVLSPGRYELRVAGFSREGVAPWAFEFTAVPEPTSAALLGLGLASLSFARRPRRR